MAETALERALRAAADSFRLGMDAQANQALVPAVDLLARHLSGLPAARAAALAATFPRLVAAQGRGDTLAVADSIEFELLPLLGAG